jgi:hypothetical protein
MTGAAQGRCAVEPANNARQIRDAIMAMQPEAEAASCVDRLFEGCPRHPRGGGRISGIRRHVAAVVSIAGAIGGSPLANDAEQYQADLLRHFPGATCTSGDAGAVNSLRPATRQEWLAKNPLPRELRYYSLATFPKPDRISWILTRSYDKLARVDARNDGQLIFYDQVIPGGTLVGYINADHWALAVPIARKHSTIGSTVVTQNAYPREALLEALLRFLEEDLTVLSR